MNVGLLVCDLPAKPVLEENGDYYRIFTSTFNIPLVPFQVFEGELPLKEDLKGFHAFIITGSSASAYNDTEWIKGFIEFLRFVHQETDIKIIGICFGFQILALALGGQVIKNDKGWEVGPTLLDLKGMMIQSMHQDIVLKLPKDWVHLAGSGKCLNQFAIYKKRYLCLQGHPEYSKEIVTKITQFRKDKWTLEFYNSVLENLNSLKVDSQIWIQLILEFINGGSIQELLNKESDRC